MRITVVTGSPHKNGNTLAMVDAFVKAAESKGHEVVRFDAAMMKIGGCHACMTWHLVGEVCIPGVLNEGDITATGGCRQAAALAEML
ncbi:MAG: flavodoxin family protein [Bacteroides sp.]|nr:flavodoxin family protein [Bacteroides sp.]